MFGSAANSARKCASSVRVKKANATASQIVTAIIDTENRNSRGTAGWLGRATTTGFAVEAVFSPTGSCPRGAGLIWSEVELTDLSKEGKLIDCLD